MGQTATQDAGVKKSSWKVSLLLALAVGLLSAVGGFCVALFVPGILSPSPSSEVAEPQPHFVPFGDVVVNLNDGRLTRFLRLSITLQTSGDEQQVKKVEAAVEAKKVIIKNWLLAYLADLSLEDIRGRAGQNRLRREIHDHLNWVLFPEGNGVINDILFVEFNIQ